MAGNGPSEVVAGRVSPVFLISLAAVIVLMFLCLILWVVLALAVDDPSPQVNTLTEGVSHAFTACLGALLGLLGGKLAS